MIRFGTPSLLIVSLIVVASAAFSQSILPFPAPKYIRSSAPPPEPGDFITLAASGLSAETIEQMPMVREEIGAGDISSWTLYDVTCDDQGTGGCTPEEGTVGFPIGWGSAMVGDGITDNSAQFNTMLNNIQSAQNEACLVFTAGENYAMNQARYENVQVYKLDGTGNSVCLKSSVTGQKASITTRSAEGQDINPADGVIDDLHATTGAPLTLAGINTAGFFILSGNDVRIGTPITMNSAFRGDDSIVTASAIPDVAAGDWLHITSNTAGFDPDNGVQYKVKVANDYVGGTTYPLDRPLPADFQGTTIQAAKWTPQTRWHIEDIHMYHQYPEHQDRSINALFLFRNMAEITILRSKFDGYQSGISLEHTARVRIETTDVTSSYDKPFNTYALIIAGSSDINLIDMAISGSESFACAGDSQNVLAAYVYTYAPPVNASFDTTCNYGPGNVEDGGDLCRWSEINSHSVAHGYHTQIGDDNGCVDIWSCTDRFNDAGTPQTFFDELVGPNPSDNLCDIDRSPVVGALATPNGVCDLREHETPAATGIATHCSNDGNIEDLLGIGGSACRGTRSDAMAGSVLLHNASCSNFVFARGQFEAGWWDDYFDGPGRYNVLFGSLGMNPNNRTVAFNGVSNGGDISTKQNATQPRPGDDEYGSSFTYPINYAKNTMIIGSNLNKIDLFDRMMHQGRFEYNVIRDECVTGIKDNNLSALDELVVDCATETTSLPIHQQGYATAADPLILSDAVYIPATSTRSLVNGTLWNRRTGSSCIITAHDDTSITCATSMNWQIGDEWSLGGTDITWANNWVGNGFIDQSGNIINTLNPNQLPSIPGLTDWPVLTVPFGENSTGTQPYVGADITGPTSPTNPQSCLPAFQRVHGGCSQP